MRLFSAGLQFRRKGMVALSLRPYPAVPVALRAFARDWVITYRA